MNRSTKKVTPKKRGRPATGKDPLVSTRMPQALIADIDAWAVRGDVKRSEAVRRLCELGLTVKTRGRQSSEDQKLRARAIAGKTIDRLSDETARADDQADRKRHLLKGPEEFREVRIDRPKRKQ